MTYYDGVIAGALWGGFTGAFLCYALTTYFTRGDAARAALRKAGRIS